MKAPRAKVSRDEARKIARLQAAAELHPDRLADLDDKRQWIRGRTDELVKLGATADELDLLLK